MVWRIDFPQAHRFFWAEVCIRCVLISCFIVTEELNPFIRMIQPEEYWLYRYPQKPAYISTPLLYYSAVASVIGVVVVFFFLRSRNYVEAWAGILVPSLALPLTGFITNCIKLTVGRPRPDFFDRCYPGVPNFDATLPCTGSDYDVTEGRKSFPSGHSSIAFSACGFISLYLAGQLGLFNSRGMGQAWKFALCLAPLLVATLAAISRTMDNHHHWQDITVGGIIGLSIVYLVYRQYFPSLCSATSATPFLAAAAQEYERPQYIGGPTVTTPLKGSSLPSAIAFGNGTGKV